LVEEQAPLSELLTNRESEFSEELAGIYGVQPNPSGKYDLSTEPNRTGLLTQLAVLGTRAGPMRASLVDRGLTIAEEFLCIHIPPPPAAAQDAVANFGKTLPPDASEREKLAAHSSAGECVGCHSMIDPFGLPFENFDLIGKYSQTDEHGNMLQGNGELTLDGQKRTYANVAEFSAIVAASKQAQDCMAEKYVQYALARQLESGETALVEHAIATSQMKGGTYAAWVSAVVSSKSFGNPAPEVLAQ
jgi:Protein of unknown function (DUF1588)/Protein of unknown function (DUF1585)